MMRVIERRALEGQRRIAAKIKECVSQHNFADALSYANSDERLRLLRTWWEGGLLTPHNLPTLLSVAWPMMDVPSRSGMRWWVDMFKAAGFVSEGEWVHRPESRLTVYRGCSPGFRFGLAWTTSLERAEWFSNEYYPARVSVSSPAVYQAEFTPRHVLAIFHQRGENEVVVNPWGLTRIVRIR